MGLARSQLKALLWRHWLAKKRSPVSTAVEVLSPVLLIGVLVRSPACSAQWGPPVIMSSMDWSHVQLPQALRDPAAACCQGNITCRATPRLMHCRCSHMRWWSRTALPSAYMWPTRARSWRRWCRAAPAPPRCPAPTCWAALAAGVGADPEAGPSPGAQGTASAWDAGELAAATAACMAGANETDVQLTRVAVSLLQAFVDTHGCAP